MKKNIIFIVSATLALILVFAAITLLEGTKEQVQPITYNDYKDETTNVKPSDEEKTQEDVQKELLNQYETHLQKQPYLGKEDAPVTMVVFGDYKCSHCATFELSNFPVIYEDYIEKGIVKYYFMNYQVLAPDSIWAGIAGEAIYKQNPNAFWEYHRKIFSQQSKPFTQAFLNEFVEKNVKDIDMAVFKKDLDSYNSLLGEVKMDVEIGNALGVQGTPSIFINQMAVPNSLDNIETAIKTYYDFENNRPRTAEEINAYVKTLTGEE